MRSLLVALVATLPACVVVQYTPALPAELSPAGEAMRRDASVVVEVENQHGETCRIDPARYPAEAGPTHIRVLHNHSADLPGRGFQCFEPMLYLLTLGLVPATCENDFEFVAEVERDGHRREIRRRYTSTRSQGWLVSILPLFPGWEIGFGDRPCQRALNSVLEELAATPPP